ncbi:phage distal tail protein [Nocardiopsis terrae]
MTELTEGQVRWRDRLLFDGRDLALVSLEGWDDLPDVDTGNAARPSRHGAWPGRPLAGQRAVTATAVLASPRGLADVGARLAPVRRALTLPEATGEHELTIRIGGETLTARGQVTARSIPGGPGYQAARPTITVQWVCSDPRRYGRARDASLQAPYRSGEGLDYPLAYPLDHGEPARGGSATLANRGDTSAHPVVEVTGPCTRPRLINRDTGRTLEFAVALATTDTLTVDCDRGTVDVNGTNRFHTLTAASVPPEHWTLAPGDNPVHFRPEAAEDTARAVVRWRDAYL